MQISVGDKVSFINEKLDGVVHSIVNSQFVKVEIDDGFIIDAEIRQLVITQKFIDKDPVQITNQIPNLVPPVGVRGFVPANTIQFVSAPAEENKILSGNVNFYLCNNTSVKILFALYAFINKKATLVDSGILEKEAERLTTNKSRNDIFEWNYFTLQILFCDDANFTRPVVKDIPVMLPDLNAVSKSENVLQSFAKYVEIANLNQPEEIPVDLLKEKLENKFHEKPTFSSPLSALRQKNPDRYRDERGDILLNTKEVDLHIEELTDDFSHLSNAEIVALQLARFTKELNHALTHHFKSIVFIHGVGNGRLKQALREELKNYPDVTFRDGDYIKYGNGATEVVLS